MKLKRNFFNRDTCDVAKKLLGKTLVRVLPDGEVLKVIITETEAYHGFEDRASHASRGKTERNKIMFDKAGLVYVYLVYGMHWCFNITTMPKNFPGAVLVREIALEVPNPKHQVPNKSQIQNPKKLNTYYLLHNTYVNGPGRVCKTLNIDKSLYSEDLTSSKKIWVEGGIDVRKSDIIASKRVGVDYAGKCKDWKWNYRISIK